MCNFHNRSIIRHPILITIQQIRRYQWIYVYLTYFFDEYDDQKIKDFVSSHYCICSTKAEPDIKKMGFSFLIQIC